MSMTAPRLLSRPGMQYTALGGRLLIYFGNAVTDHRLFQFSRACRTCGALCVSDQVPRWCLLPLRLRSAVGEHFSLPL